VLKKRLILSLAVIAYSVLTFYIRRNCDGSHYAVNLPERTKRHESGSSQHEFMLQVLRKVCQQFIVFNTVFTINRRDYNQLLVLDQFWFCSIGK